jgi:diaminopimelate decarboxylase
MLLGTQRINSAGHLEIGGCDTVDLANQFGTPLYVLDEATFRSNCRRFREACDRVYPKCRIYYASKAFLTLAIARIVDEESLHMDVASLGELEAALAAPFPPERLALHGNNKSREELSLAVAARVGHIVVDNFLEIDLLTEIAEEQGAQVDVMVRTTPGVDPNTHRLIRTGQADTKFGFNIADGSALRAVKKVLASPRLTFRGIHCHIGSQLLDSDTHELAAEIMVGLAKSVIDETGAEIEEINIGGGLGVRYLESHHPPTYNDFAEQVVGRVLSACEATGVPLPTIALEPGRALVGEAGTTLYSVGAIKTVPTTTEPGTRTYVAVDGGLSDNPRPQMYGAVYSCILANRANEEITDLVTIAGKHCETDILIWDTRLPAPQTGDVLAVQTTGAYNFVMASNYNRFLRPAVVLVADGQADLIVKRETVEDLMRNEVVPARLCAGVASV